MPLLETEILNNIIARVFRIESITLGDSKRGYVARYQGHLLGDDSATTYDQLTESLSPYSLTPLFHEENDKQTIFLVHEAEPPELPRVSKNILSFWLLC